MTANNHRCILEWNSLKKNVLVALYVMFIYNLLMDTESTNKSKVRKRKAALNLSFCVKKERNTVYQKVSNILRKPLSERSNDEIEFLNNSKDIVQQISHRKAQRQKVKDRAQEYEDPANVLAEKCKILAEAVINSNHLVVYTGAGISTAARIPDYRGTNGIWTLLQQGKDIGLHDLSRAEPTLTHMALYCLYRCGVLKHVVSQNCDGLHLRSGIPRAVMSEVHGNMYLEVCLKCKPSKHYLRLFDVTEYTARYSHETLRLCYKCGNPLKDTIVHFGERGKLQWPLNWETACKQADKADVILCLGSSLKVLKKYPWLWRMDKPAKKRPKLYIVNLQWTPKDDHSTLKINGKCDTVIEQMMSYLGLTIPKYTRGLDPIFYHATLLNETELHTTSRSPIEKFPSMPEKESSDKEVKPEDLKSHDNKISMCSPIQDNNLLDTKIKVTVNGDARETDLITSNNLVLEDNAAIKKECNSDANSDKENDILSAVTDVKKKVSAKDGVQVKIEKESDDDYDVDVSYDEQSNLSVINDNSVEYIVPEVFNESTELKVKTEIEDDSIESATESNLNKSTGLSVSNLSLQTCASNFTEARGSSLNVLYGRNLWSELTLFDTLTRQPVFFGDPILGWNNINTCSSLLPYCLNNQSHLFNTYFNYANIVQSSATVTSKDTVECSPSSSVAVLENSTVEIAVDQAACSFCFDNYNSQNCLFYAGHESNSPFEATVLCLCCGGDEDDDEQEEQEEEPDKNASKVVNVNPGWFGKGYRKKIKKRK